MPQLYHHLDLSERNAIENGLKAKRSVQEIAKLLGRPTATIKREVFRNRVRPDIQQVKTCRQMRNDCTKRVKCQQHHLCTRCDGPMDACRFCDRCNEVCAEFVADFCERRDRSHGCCNNCKEYLSCKMKRWRYNAKTAQKLADTRLSESRTGLSLTEEELLTLNEIVSAGLKKGQSLHAIVVNNREEIVCSERTLYKLVGQSRFDARNIDMPLLVRRRVRKKTIEHKVDRSCRIGRTYDDFLVWKEENNGLMEVQMDTVVGTQGSQKALLTLYWTNANFLYIVLLERRTAGAVNEVFQYFQTTLGKTAFQKLFPGLLTDRGSEFSHPTIIEGPDGEVWTKLFYCDANAAYQKGALEQEHTMIRKVIPKGKSFDHLNNDHIALLNSHITSYTRPSLNDRTPQDMFRFIHNVDPLELFGLMEIKPNDVTLKPQLLPRAKEHDK